MIQCAVKPFWTASIITKARRCIGNNRGVYEVFGPTGILQCATASSRDQVGWIAHLDWNPCQPRGRSAVETCSEGSSATTIGSLPSAYFTRRLIFEPYGLSYSLPLLRRTERKTHGLFRREKIIPVEMKHGPHRDDHRTRAKCCAVVHCVGQRQHQRHPIGDVIGHVDRITKQAR